MRAYGSIAANTLPVFLWGKMLSVDFNNELQTVQYTQKRISGISDRNGSFTAKFARTAKADFDVHALRDAGTQVNFDFTVVDDDGTSYSRLKVRGQIEQIKDVDQDGYRFYEVTGPCIASDSGGDELAVEFGLDSLRVIGDLPDAAAGAYSQQLNLQGVYGSAVTWSVLSGTTWALCANPGTLTSSERRFSKITMSGTDHNTLWWAFRTGPNGQKIFKSTDAGATWINWTTSTLNNIDATDILHQLGTDGGVYFVSGNGSKVYYRDNSASDWMAYGTGLPLNLYGDFGGAFLKAYYKGGKLRLAGGHGIWEADLCAVSITTLVQPMVDNATPTCSRDTIQLESYSVINGNASYQWSLSPAPQWISDSNARNPRAVLGSTPGAYSVTLSVTDDNGTATRTINVEIVVRVADKIRRWA